MLRKLAVKRLTQSDLTIFAWHFKNQPAGNQKAINLNADVFSSILYPLLSELAIERNGRFSLDLFIYGPGSNVLHNLQRKIIKGGTYKNWRLNGEFIYNPIEEPKRYNLLKANDLAVMEFSGSAYPESAKVIFLASEIAEDQVVLEYLSQIIGNKSMAAISPIDLDQILHRISIDHPMQHLSSDDELEKAVYSGDIDPDLLLLRPNLRKITKQDFFKAKKSAEESGERGEEIINEFLDRSFNESQIEYFEWVSKVNPIYPYDFIVKYLDGPEILIDIKSTAGSFQNEIYISYNELKQMAAATRYDLYRVYSINDENAKLRIAQNVKSFAIEILKTLSQLPNGVKSNGVTVLPDKLIFGEEQLIYI